QFFILTDFDEEFEPIETIRDERASVDAAQAERRLQELEGQRRAPTSSNTRSSATIMISFTLVFLSSVFGGSVNILYFGGWDENSWSWLFNYCAFIGAANVCRSVWKTGLKAEEYIDSY
ncbi:hypothetical protein PFISCL1PPCAC_24555, partial [Pristionchus fissidentatus]